MQPFELYNFSDEFYSVPNIDIFRIFFSGFFLGISCGVLIEYSFNNNPRYTLRRYHEYESF